MPLDAVKETQTDRLPYWLQIPGAAILVGAASLTARIVWEETVWTWQRGPQMVGFSLAHGFGAILFFFPILLIIWTVLALVLIARSKMKKHDIARETWVFLAAAALLFGLEALPEGFWQTVFASRMAASPRAGDLLLYAAYRGDLSTVRALITHGVPVDAKDHSSWRTALHGAAAKGDTKTIQYLLSQGANVNSLDRSGDSPLELADENRQQTAAKLLAARGGQQIRGDEAKHRKAIDDKVREDTEELDRTEAADPKLQQDIRKAEQEPREPRQ